MLCGSSSHAPPALTAYLRAPFDNNTQQQQNDSVALDGVVTVVDAVNITRHLDKVGKDSDADAVNEAVEQVAYADRIIINKTDLVR